MKYGDCYRDRTDGEVLMFVAEDELNRTIWLMLLDGDRTRAAEKDHPLVRGDNPTDTPEDWEKLS